MQNMLVVSHEQLTPLRRTLPRHEGVYALMPDVRHMRVLRNFTLMFHKQ
jgi:hypothetical protein